MKIATSKSQWPHALKFEAVRAGFDHGMGLACGDHLGEQRLSHLGLGGRFAGGVRAPLVADLELDAVDQARGMAGGGQQRVGEIGRGRLAVGAGDADDGQLARGELVPGRGQIGQR